MFLAAKLVLDTLMGGNIFSEGFTGQIKNGSISYERMWSL